MIIPFARVLKEGMEGRDVVAVKRALREWWPNSINNRTRVYGPVMAEAVKGFQRARQQPTDGVYGERTHKVLAQWFDAYGAWLILNSGHMPSPPRKKLVAAALAVYNWRLSTGRMHYSQGPARMMIVRDKLKPPFRHTLYEDCSSLVTGLYWIAGLPDPNGPRFSYNGFGYTGTLAEAGHLVDRALPGDLILYGRGWPYSHVAIAIGDDVTMPTRRAIGHGSEGGPRLHDIDYRSDRAQIRRYVAE